jgi:GT2 family glycosyltransferase
MPGIDLSICIVTYQAGKLLKDCLLSIDQNPPAGKYEIIVVDNGSTDGTLDLLCSEFKDRVQLIENRENRGYTVPMNQALRRGEGRFLLQLNPDTLLLPGTFDRLIEYMETHPEVGICGPKVLNRDGTLQKPCRRGESRPWAVFTYFTGLWKLFPQPVVRRVLMNYLMRTKPAVDASPAVYDLER